jgi:hypothetical protein
MGAVKVLPREDLLHEAIRLITKDRNNQYGKPTQDFERIANLLSALGFTAASGGTIFGPIKPHQVAMMMIALKLSRLAWDPTNRDSWADIAGYAGCGYECVVTGGE